MDGNLQHRDRMAFIEGFLDDVQLPWVVRPAGRAGAEELFEWIAHRRDALDERLKAIGAVLFRGFELGDAADLDRAIRAANGAKLTLPYVGGDTPRTRVSGNVYTTTEVPPQVVIPLHNELSYLPVHPRRLFFLCTQPAESGGETTIADGRAVYAALDPRVRERFVDRGVRYVAIHPRPHASATWMRRLHLARKSWPEVFETDEPAVAEERCRALELSYRWLPSGSLHTSIVRPAALDGGWFNQAHLFRMTPSWMGRFQYTMAALLYHRREGRGRDAQYGDGGEIDPAALDHIHEVLRRHTVARRWQRGDLLIVDNLRCMHGRSAFRGRRRVLVAMTG
jgi:alpha-ketoglutarate-dependent taurine dioxygenase